MAIQFDATALNVFRNTGLTGNNTIANLNGENGLKSGGTWSKSIKILGRSGDERTANNAVRTKLLEALGRAFGLERDMAAGEDGKMRFSKAFMDRLEDLLGAAAFKRSDFGIDETGLVTSGKPLTKRRIDSILAKADFRGTLGEATGYEYGVYKKKCEFILDKIKGTKVSLSKAAAKDSAIRLYGQLDKVMDFLDTEVEDLIVENEDYDGIIGEPRYLINTNFKGKKGTQPLTHIRDVVGYINRRLQTILHISENILGKDDLATDPDTGLKLDHARLEDLEDPARQIKDYVQRILTNYVTFSIDLFFASEKAGEATLDRFMATISKAAVCVEGKIKDFAVFKVANIKDEAAKATHGNDQPLHECIGIEIGDIMNKHPEVDSWEKCAGFVKENLKRARRPMSTAEKVGEQWKFRTLKDEKGQPVVREITDEDIDAIGPAVWEDCNPPDEDEE